MKELSHKITRSMLLLCSVLLLTASLIGCGSKTDPGDGDTQAAIDMDALNQAMLAADTTLPDMVTVTDKDDQAELNFGSFSDFEYDRVASYFYSYAKEGGSEEIAVVELKDAQDAAALMNTMQQHLQDRRGALESYAPDQLTLIDHAVIKQKGRYVAMIISPKSGLIQQAFEAE